MAPTVRAPDLPTPAPAPRSLPAVAWKVLVAGLLIREGFSFWTGHPYDFEDWIRTGYAVAQGYNPYGYLPPVSGVSISYLSINLPGAAYFPFWSLLMGGLYRLWEAVGFHNRFVLYFLLKQPPIVGDMVTAYLLYRVAEKWSGHASAGLSALTFWSFFPYAILIGAIWGQFDSIVVALILATFFYRDPLERNILYGWGIFIKYVTAIYLPLEAFVARGWRRAYFLLAVAIPLATTVAVFFATGWGITRLVADSVAETHGNGGGMNWVGIITSGPLDTTIASIPGLDFALSYLWIPAVLIACWVAARWYAPHRPAGLLRAMVLVTTVWLLFRWGLFEQYMLYLFALLVLDTLVFHPERRPLFDWISYLSLAYLVVNNDFLIRFAAPLSPGISSFLISLDASYLYGGTRTYLILGLIVLVTVTLVQLVWTYYRDDPAPWRWWKFEPSSRPSSTPPPMH